MTENADQPITCLIADDHEIVREGLRMALSREPNIRVVGEASDGEAAVVLAERRRPAVVLMDVRMGNVDGVTAASRIRDRVPGTAVVLFTAHAERNLLQRGREAGARGYVLKQASPEEFVQAIEKVNAGESFFSPDLARVALNQLVQGNGPGPDPADLTTRELEVLSQIAEGLCNKEIARRLNIGTRTVETHRERLMRKLDIHSIAGLTRFAITKGLIHMPEMALAEA